MGSKTGNPDTSSFAIFGNRLRTFGYDFRIASSAIIDFTSTLVSGGPIVQGFLHEIENLAGAVLKYSTKAFNDAADKEVDAIASAGAIVNITKGAIGFAEAGKLYGEAQIKLSKIAASDPGSTSDFTFAYTQLLDDFGSAAITAMSSTAEMKKVFTETSVNMSRAVVLQSKLYGANIPVTSITRSFAGLVNTGEIKKNEIFFKRNPVFGKAVEDYEKENGSLKKMSKQDRLVALGEITGKMVSPEQMAALLNSFQSKIEGLKSKVFDPLDGLFGFKREVTGSDGKKTTMFDTLSNLLKPLLSALTDVATTVTTFADPVKFLTDFIDSNVRPSFEELVYLIQQVTTEFAFSTEINFYDRLNDALKKVFNFDMNQFDLSNEIDKLFNNIVSWIDNAGKGAAPDSELAQAARSILSGVVRVVLAILGRAKDWALENPGDALAITAALNPGLISAAVAAVAAAITLLVSVVSLLTGTYVGIIGLFTSIGAAFGFVGGAATAFGAAVVLVVALIIGLGLGAIDAFREPIQKVSDWIQEQADKVGGALGTSLAWVAEGIAGILEGARLFTQGVVKIMNGDFAGGVKDMVVGLIVSLGGLFRGLAGILTTPFTALFDSFIALGSWVLGLMGIGSERKNTEVLKTKQDVLNASDSSFTIELGADGKLQTGPEITPNYGPAFQPFATGNSFGNLLGSLARERSLAPTGSNLVVANSSEAIIPNAQAKNVQAALSGNGKSMVANIVINGVNSAEDIAAAIRRELGALMAEV